MNKWPEPTVDEPDMSEFHDWLFDMDDAYATDGCTVEMDGICPHGHPSWMLRLGMI